MNTSPGVRYPGSMHTRFAGMSMPMRVVTRATSDPSPFAKMGQVASRVTLDHRISCTNISHRDNSKPAPGGQTQIEMESNPMLVLNSDRTFELNPEKCFGLCQAFITVSLHSAEVHTCSVNEEPRPNSLPPSPWTDRPRRMIARKVAKKKVMNSFSSGTSRQSFKTEKSFFHRHKKLKAGRRRIRGKEGKYLV
ncbi:uncharacterized protein MYCFIDRAFT_212604 [Pseudocercospora fijiensis CIRAD86]|uniref:Uncharacterized protein n=1 Tax=Pseudocercospora fijiensis (strain CIRAD86) TaxID=383855 RepID=M3A0N0_PSEFD|nr:uncharacterized protein MYCFIDRAFT_212604 [Pseudocercospora fijiensis CIRAD86]EME77966.1 hypothetical protein MYCFIDRAFT_212604 [Pseudocercospora fijiensis CIRAD86]